MNAIKNFLQEEEGAVAIEYALLAGLIAVAIIVGAKLLGDDICATLNGIANGFATTNSTAADFAPLAC